MEKDEIIFWAVFAALCAGGFYVLYICESNEWELNKWPS